MTFFPNSMPAICFEEVEWQQKSMKVVEHNKNTSFEDLPGK